jgi:hypothetical protein
MCVALILIMANKNNENKNNLNQDEHRQRTGQQGAADKQQQPKGAPTAGNRDSDRGGKMPPDKEMPRNDELDVEVGDDRSPQRAPQAGPGKPDFGRS